MVVRLLDIDLNLKSIDVSKSEQMNAEFVAINPCHCVLCIVDEGYVLWESRAIVTYLLTGTDPHMPYTRRTPGPEPRSTDFFSLIWDLFTEVFLIMWSVITHSDIHFPTNPSHSQIYLIHT